MHLHYEPIQNDSHRFKTIVRLIFLILLVALLLLLFRISLGQASEKESIRVDTDLVLVNVLVCDKNAHLVKGLGPGQFEVFIDGKKRSIESFSSESAGISFGIIFDMHPTTDERTRSVIDSLSEFKANLRSADDLFLVAFKMEGEQTFDFIPTIEQLDQHLSNPLNREPYSLYDAIYFASELLEHRRNQKRTLLIISDSADHHSRHNFSQVRQKIGDVRAEAYAVIFDDSNGFGYSDISHQGRPIYPYTKDATALDRAAMMDLSLKSGGSTYIGVSENSLRLSRIYMQIAEEMQFHYTLGFYPEVLDDKQHTVEVRLRDVYGSKDFTLNYPISFRIRKRLLSREN